jgi:hypothetical protein
MKSRYSATSRHLCSGSAVPAVRLASKRTSGGRSSVFEGMQAQ